MRHFITRITGGPQAPERSTGVAMLSAATLIAMTGCSAAASVESDSALPSPPPLSADWRCKTIMESADGRYDVDGAGQVRIFSDGEDLMSVEVAATPGYEDADSRLYDRVAEVEFRDRTTRSGVMLRVEVGDNGGKAQLCRM